MALLVLTACQLSPIDIPVDIPVQDFDAPVADTLGLICYFQMEEKAPVKPRYATYTAQATYQSSGTAPVNLKVYGRKTAPQFFGIDSPCVDVSAADISLSDTIEISANLEQAIEIGGDNAFGVALADLSVTPPPYWLGVSVSSSTFGITEERLFLKEGNIRAVF